jgi:hypothetical protein
VYVAAPLHLLDQLRQRRVALLLQQRAQRPLACLVDLPRHATAVRPRRYGALRARQGEIVLHGVRGDCEPFSQLPDSSFTVPVSIHDPLPQVDAVRAHALPCWHRRCHPYRPTSWTCTKRNREPL